jgi:hypothetical protein
MMTMTSMYSPKRGFVPGFGAARAYLYHGRAQLQVYATNVIHNA